MIRCFSAAWIVVAFVGTAYSAEPRTPDSKLKDRVEELIRLLGNDDFDQRQQAEVKLIELGSAILPVLDRLEPADPEAVFRIRKVRLAVGGFREKLRDLLEVDAVQVIRPDGRGMISQQTLDLIKDQPAQAGECLLEILANPKHRLERAAAESFLNSWAKMSGDHIRIFMERTLQFEFTHRNDYPRGVDAMIAVGYFFRRAWGSDSPNVRSKILTVVSHELDGQPYEKPFRYHDVSTGATSTSVRTKDLALGKHKFSAEVKFEIEHLGKKVKGSVRSPTYFFTMLPADTPDDLIATKDPELEKRFREAFWIGETSENKDNILQGRMLLNAPPTDWWRPQVTWTEKDGKPNGLHLPVFRLGKPLPVDLAFDVALRIEGTNKEFEGYSLVETKNSIGNMRYLSVKDSHALAKGRSGFVTVRVILRPSRAVALSDTRVTKYYPFEFISEPLRIKVGPADDAAVGK